MAPELPVEDVGGIGALPIISAGLQVLGSGMDIIQGINAKKDQKDAERAAAEYLRQAKQQISVNRMEEVQVPLDAYGLQTQAMLAGQQQSIEALREGGQRALQGGLSKAQLATQAGFEQQRQAMGRDIYERDLMIAEEQSRIDQTLASLDLQSAAGAQMAAAQREQMAAQSFSGAVQGLGSAAQGLYEASPLYSERQGQLDAAKAYQEQTGMYQDMNTRQARRAMINDGITQQGFGNLASGLTVGGRKVATPIPSITPKGLIMPTEPIMPTATGF